MALALVQSAGNAQATTGVNTMAVSFSAAGANNLLVATVGVTNSATANLASLSTPAGWSRVVGADHSGAASPAVAIYWKKAAGGETSVSIVSTQAGGVSSILSCELMEFSGYTSWNVDVSNTGDSAGTVTSLQTGTTGTLATATEVVIGAVAAQNTVSAESWNSSFNSVDHSTTYLLAAYLLTSATTALNPTASWTTARTAVGGIVAFSGPVAVNKSFTGLQNVGGPVNKSFTGKQNVGGAVNKSFTGKQNVGGPIAAGWTIRTEVAWSTAPLTRPTEGYVGAGGDWSKISDHSDGVQSLTAKRGMKILSTGFETGTASAVIENRARAFDPAYTAGAYYPNVIPRRRIRHVLCDAAGNVIKVLHTGFIEDYQTQWALDTASVTIPSQDLFGILAGVTLPPSVLDVVTRGLDTSAPVTVPTAYWPMHEQVLTGQADDVMGSLDGIYYGPVANGSQLTAHDPRPSPQFAKPGTVNGDGITTTAMIVNPVSMPDTFSFGVWVKWNVGGYDANANPSILMVTQGSPPTTDPTPPTLTPTPSLVSMYLGQSVAIPGDHHINIRVQDGSNVAILRTAIDGMIMDGLPHHLAFSITGSTRTVKTWIDGHGATPPDSGLAGTVNLSTLNVSSIISSLNTIGVGWGIDWQTTTGSVADSAIVGEMVYWNGHFLTDTEVNYILDAGNKAWDGDLVHTRVGRLYDLGGVAAGDRSFDTCTQTCGPAVLASQNLMAAVKKAVATEQGGHWVNGDGKARLTARPSSPAVRKVFTDDPTGDSGVPPDQIGTQGGWTRIVNTLRGTRENGADIPLQDATSYAKFGALSGSTGGTIDTIHQTADDLRTTLQYIIDGHKNPVSVIPAVRVESIDRGVDLDALVNVDITDVIAVRGRPPSPTVEPVSIKGPVEAVQYDFPSAVEMVTTYTPGDGVLYTP